MQHHAANASACSARRRPVARSRGSTSRQTSTAGGGSHGGAASGADSAAVVVTVVAERGKGPRSPMVFFSWKKGSRKLRVSRVQQSQSVLVAGRSGPATPTASVNWQVISVADRRRAGRALHPGLHLVAGGFGTASRGFWQRRGGFWPPFGIELFGVAMRVFAVFFSVLGGRGGLLAFGIRTTERIRRRSARERRGHASTTTARSGASAPDSAPP